MASGTPNQCLQPQICYSRQDVTAPEPHVCHRRRGPPAPTSDSFSRICSTTSSPTAGSADAARELALQQGSRRAETHRWSSSPTRSGRTAQPKKALHLEVLTEWLAAKVELPYRHIDPFKIDFAG